MSSTTDSSSGERTPLTRMRRAVAVTMTASAAVPQFTLVRSAEIASVQALINDQRPSDPECRFTLEDVLVKACAHALRAHPEVNSSFDTDAIVAYQEINIGLATAVPGGLISPALLGADRYGLAELASARRRLRAAARAGKLKVAELTAATFTITNLGPYDIDSFQALVIPPQAAILAVGSARQDRVTLSLSCDHRVLDGAPAAEFLRTVVDSLGQGD